jgi:integrase
MPEKIPLTKSSKKYWLDRVYRPVANYADGVKESPNFAVKLSYGGRSMRLSLNLSDRIAAAERARDMFVFLSAHGWTEFLAEYRGDNAKRVESAQRAHSPVALKGDALTVGKFLDAVQTESDLSEKTFRDYAVCLRFLVAEIRSLEKSRARHDYRKGGRTKWIEAIDKTPLTEITGDKLRAWQKAYIARAGRDELKRRRFTSSATSYLRRARALFSPRVLEKLRSVELGQPSPFKGLTLTRPDTRFFGSGVDPVELLQTAVTELSAAGKVEELKVILLSLTTGLRRKEIDLLTWDSLNFDAGLLRVTPNQFHSLKTARSAAELPLEPEVCAIFRGFKARAKSPYVIESDTPAKATSYQFYRCQEVFRETLGWLRSKGVTGDRPLHVLRKCYGSVLADRHGLHAASIGLRHSSVATTAQYYLDSRIKLTPNFGPAISAVQSGALVPFSGVTAEEKATRRN